MSDVKRLLEQATPLPWRWVRDSGSTMVWGASGDPGGEGHVLTPHVCKACDDRGAPCLNFSEADSALFLHAVNHLPDYEAAVDALEALAPWLHRGYTLLTTNPAVSDQDPSPLQDAALAALRRLRGETVPS